MDDHNSSSSRQKKDDSATTPSTGCKASLTNFSPSPTSSLLPRLGNQPGTDTTPQQRAQEAIRLVAIIKETCGSLATLSPPLSSVESVFIQDMAHLLQQYGQNAFVTPRKLYYLRDIKDKLIRLGL